MSSLPNLRLLMCIEEKSDPVLHAWQPIGGATIDEKATDVEVTLGQSSGRANGVVAS